MKVVLLFMVSFLLAGCISTYEMQCTSDYKTFHDRLQCFRQGYGQAMKDFQSRTQYDGKYTYNETVLCADNLTDLVTTGKLSDEDAWSVFLAYYFNPEDSNGACDADGILNKIRERKKIQQFRMDKKIEEDAFRRNP